MVKTNGRSTNPWNMSRCSRGSMSGTNEPRVVPMKWRDDGVIIPTESCSGAATWKTRPKASGDGRLSGGCAIRTDETNEERPPYATRSSVPLMK